MRKKNDRGKKKKRFCLFVREFKVSVNHWGFIRDDQSHYTDNGQLAPTNSCKTSTEQLLISNFKTLVWALNPVTSRILTGYPTNRPQEWWRCNGNEYWKRRKVHFWIPVKVCRENIVSRILTGKNEKYIENAFEMCS